MVDHRAACADPAATRGKPLKGRASDAHVSDSPRAQAAVTRALAPLLSRPRPTPLCLSDPCTHTGSSRSLSPAQTATRSPTTSPRPVPFSRSTRTLSSSGGRTFDEENENPSEFPEDGDYEAHRARV